MSKQRAPFETATGWRCACLKKGKDRCRVHGAKIKNKGARRR